MTMPACSGRQGQQKIRFEAEDSENRLMIDYIERIPIGHPIGRDKFIK